MYERLRGTLLIKNPPTVVLDCQGVGYEINVPMSVFYDLPDIGHSVTLLTHFVVREDAQLLFGFLHESERWAFRQLIKVSGIGARTALSVLSGLSATELQLAITQQEVGRLIKIPGIGKKTAERLLLELKGAWGGSSLPQIARPASSHDDIGQALLALGYSDKEVKVGLAQLPADCDVSTGIRQTLAFLAR